MFPPAIFHGGYTSQEGPERLDAAVSSGSGIHLEMVNYKKNGKEFFVSIILSPVLGDDKQVDRWISIQREVTQQKRYTEQIHHKDRGSSGNQVATVPCATHTPCRDHVPGRAAGICW